MKPHWVLPCTRFDQEFVWGGGEERRNESYALRLESGSIRRISYPSGSG